MDPKSSRKATRKLNPCKLWHVWQGLPLSAENVAGELYQAYNCCLDFIQSRHSYRDDDSVEISTNATTVELLHTTLCRVLRVCAPEQKIIAHDKSSEHSCFLLQLCIESCRESHRVLLLPLGLLVVISTNLLKNEVDRRFSIALLQLLLMKIQQFIRNKPIAEHGTVFGQFPLSEESFSISLDSQSDVPNCKNISLFDLIQMHLGFYYIDEGNLQTCNKHLSKITSLFQFHRDPKLLYILGFVYYRCGAYSELRRLLKQWSSQPVVSQDCAAQLWNLYGCLQASENNHLTAVKMYKEALVVDPNYTVAVYNISQQYRQLGRTEDELAMLQRIISKLDTDSTELSQAVYDVTDSQPTVTARHTFSVEEAMYTLASRYQQLGRYGPATEKYRELLVRLTDTSVESQASSQLVPLPETVQIKLDFAFCLLHLEHWTECVAVSNDVLGLDKQENTQSFMDSQNSQSPNSSGAPETDRSLNKKSMGSDMSMRVAGEVNGTCTADITQSGPKQCKGAKRLRSVEDTEMSIPRATISPQNPHQFIALMYKTDALIMSGHPNEALLCLNSVIKRLSDVCQIPGVTTSAQSASKRRKIDAEDHTEPGGDSWSDMLTPETLAESLQKRAVILVGQGRLHEAEQSSSSALELSPDDSTAVYNHCLLLLKLDRRTEVTELWLKHRHITLPVHPLQLAKLVQNIKDKSESVCAVSASSNDRFMMTELDERSLLNMDIIALEQHMEQS